MHSLTLVSGTTMYEKVGELVGALHTSLAFRAIKKYINNIQFDSLVAHGLHIHRAHRVYHLKVTLCKCRLRIHSILLSCDWVNETILCAVMKYFQDEMRSHY